MTGTVSAIRARVPFLLFLMALAAPAAAVDVIIEPVLSGVGGAQLETTVETRLVRVDKRGRVVPVQSVRASSGAGVAVPPDVQTISADGEALTLDLMPMSELRDPAGGELWYQITRRAAGVASQYLVRPWASEDALTLADLIAAQSAGSVPVCETVGHFIVWTAGGWDCQAVAPGSGISDAPSDGTPYARQDASWLALGSAATTDAADYLTAETDSAALAAIGALTAGDVGAEPAGMVSAPSTPTDACTAGQRAWESPYLYTCVSANAWVRVTPERSW